MLVKFLKSRTVQDGTGTSFVAGAVYDLPEDSAARWIRRNVAVPASDSQPPANPAESLLVSAAPEIAEPPPAKPEPPPIAKTKPDAFKRSDIKKT